MEFNRPAFFMTNENLKNKQTSDSLANCLIHLANYYNYPLTNQIIKAGLPISHEEKLTPDLAVRVAERIGFNGDLISATLQEIDLYRLPAILIVNHERCYIIKNHSENQYELIDPEQPNQSIPLTSANLTKQEIYLILYIEPNLAVTERAKEQVQATSVNWFWSTITQAWPIYGEILIASFLINLFALASPLFVMNVYDRVVPNSATDTLWVLASGVLLAFIFDILLRSLRAFFIDAASKHIDQKLSAKVFAQILGLKMQDWPNSVGAFMHSVHGFESFRDFITSTTVTVLIDVPFVFLYIFFILLIGGWLALIPTILIPIVLAISFILMKPLKKLTEELQIYTSERHATLVESLSSVETIKCEQAENLMQKRWETVNKSAGLTGIKLRSTANLAIHFSIFIQQFASVLTVIWGVYFIVNNALTTGGLIACTILTGRALAGMSQIASLMTKYNQSKASLDSIAKIMSLPNETEIGQKLISREKYLGEIEFKKINFTYPKQSIPSLQQVSFDIKAGERVGIIGRIGSGKTTISKLIMNLYEAEAGIILLDGLELHQLNTFELRKNIGYVPQDIVLFYGTVKENIRFGKSNISDEEILKAGKIAGIDRFLNQHPSGYELQVGEKGSKLSGGQRQAIALARAIISNPPILLLDEPTNSMDDSTEALVKTNLAEFSKDKTLILITHKASMLSLVDRIIVVDEGKIVADGSKETVLNALKAGKIKVSNS